MLLVYYITLFEITKFYDEFSLKNSNFLNYILGDAYNPESVC